MYVYKKEMEEKRSFKFAIFTAQKYNYFLNLQSFLPIIFPFLYSFLSIR